MEKFMKPAVGGIIEKSENGIDYVLVQDRCKDDAKSEYGLVEIPAGKIRESENIFDALRREIWEETGLEVTRIHGEDEAIIYESKGYKTINYTPFSSTQNVQGTYPIMVQVFLCNAEGTLLDSSNETKNLRWISIEDLSHLLNTKRDTFYPMHVVTLEKYLRHKQVEL